MCNAASSERRGNLGSMAESDWAGFERTVSVCQHGAAHTAHFAAKQLVAQVPAGSDAQKDSNGKILFIGSLMSRFAACGTMAYSMSKAAIEMLSFNLAKELAPHRINVNIILPGYIDTPGELKFAAADGMAKAAYGIPWKRVGGAKGHWQSRSVSLQQPGRLHHWLGTQDGRRVPGGDGSTPHA